MTEPARVGVRELRQNLSVYLRRVAAGESFVVTERREPVAELVPLDREETEHEAWLRRNKLKPASGRLEDLPPPLKLNDGGPSISQILEQDREERLD